MFTVRQLTPDDAAQLRAMRVLAVTDSPSAFSASVEEEARLTVEQVAQQLAEGPPHTCTFGALEDGRLLGVLSLFRFQRPKLQHKAMLGGMFVAPDARRRGVGQALLEAAMALAHTLAGLQTITLAVTVGNDSARKLYLGAGFTPYGVEPRYIRVGDASFDIEWMYRHLPGDAR